MTSRSTSNPDPTCKMSAKCTCLKFKTHFRKPMNSGLRRKLCQILCECVLFAVYTFKSSLYHQTLDQQSHENGKWKLKTELEKNYWCKSFRPRPDFRCRKLGARLDPPRERCLMCLVIIILAFNHYHFETKILCCKHHST